MQKTISFFLLVISSLLLHAQQASTRGTEFWVTYMNNNGNNTYAANGFKLTLHFSATQNATVTVSNPNTGYSKSLTVPANTLVSDTVSIANSSLYNVYGSAVNKALKITSTTEITAYALNYAPATADATVILPITALGVNYKVISYKSTTISSEFAIVATQDNTQINITPSCKTGDGHVRNITYSITLNKGQAYQVKSFTDSTLTGTAVDVQNCKPIAVFGGSICTNIPGSCAYCDHLFEQLYPTNTWGKQFIIIPTATRSHDRFVVVADKAGTTLTIRGNSVSLTNAGDWYEDTTSVPLIVSSNKPVSTMIYAVGQQCGGTNGDPMMMWVTPVEQKIENIMFVNPASSVISGHYVNIVARTSTVGSIKLNGVNIGNSFTVVPGNTSYSYIKKSVSAGANALTSDSGFTAYAYGYGNAESYGYNIGSSVLDLQKYFTFNGIINDNHSSQTLYKKVCKNNQLSFNGVSNGYNPLYWHWYFNNDTVSTQNVTRTFTDTGLVKIMMITARLINNNLCSASDTVVDTSLQYVKVIDPTVIITTPDTIVCKGNSFQVRVNYSGDNEFKWTNGADLDSAYLAWPVITASTSKWYRVNIGGVLFCDVADSFYVRVLDSTQFSLSSDTTICRGRKAVVRATVTNPDTLNHYTYSLYKGTTLISTDTIGSFDVYPDTTTLYYFKIQSTCYTKTSANIKVAVRDTLKATYIDSFQICRNTNNSFYFKVYGGDSSYTAYLLKNAVVIDSLQNLSANTNYSFNFYPDPLSSFKIIIKDGCTLKADTQQLRFSYRDSLHFTHTSDTLVCRGQSFQLYIRPVGGDSTYKIYLLKNGTLVDSITNAVYNVMRWFTVSTQANAAYKMVLVDGCTIVNDTQSINVTTRNPLSFTFNINYSVCEGTLSPIKIIPSGGDSTYTIYLLDHNIKVDSIQNAVPNTQYQFNVHPTILNQYKVVVYDGCTMLNDTQSIVYSFRVPLSFTHTQDTMICTGQTIPLHLVPWGGDSTYDAYLLKNNIRVDSLKNISIGNHYYFSVSPAGPSTQYSMILLDGCTYLNDTEKIIVSLRNPLHLTVVNDSQLCRGEKLPVKVMASGGDSSYTIRLYTNNIKSDSIINAVPNTLYTFNVYPVTGNSYKLVLSDGCTIKPDTQNIFITLRQPLSFTHSRDSTICLGQTYPLRVTPKGGDSSYAIYFYKNNVLTDSIKNAFIGNDYYFNITPLTSASYSFVLKDFCTAQNDSQGIRVNVRAPLHFAFSIDSFICEGSLTQIPVIASGGDSTYTIYLLDSTSRIDSIVNVAAGQVVNFYTRPTFKTRLCMVLTDGCTILNDSQKFQYTFRLPLNFTHSPDTTICTGQPVTFRFTPYGGDSIYDYYLVRNNTILDSIKNTTLGIERQFTTIAPSSSDYFLILGDGCTYLNDTQKIHIQLRDPLHLVVENDSQVCRGQSLPVKVKPYGGDSTYSIYLYQNGLPIDSVKNATTATTYTFSFTPPLNPSYYFVLKDGCTIKNDTQNIFIKHRAALSFTHSPDTTICIGQRFDMRITPFGGDSTYTLYLLENSLAIDSIKNASIGNNYYFHISPAVSTRYKLVIKDGCTWLNDSQDILTKVRTPLKLTLDKDTIICKGRSYNIPVWGTGGDSSYTYYLLKNGNAIDSIRGAQSQQAYSFLVSPVVKTVYQVLMQDGCTSLDEIAQYTVDVYPPLIVKAGISKTKICRGESVDLTSQAFGGFTGAVITYLWNNGAGSGKNVSIIPDSSKYYRVGADDGCSPTAYDSVYIDVEQNPIADFTTPNPKGCEPFDARINNTSTLFVPVKYFWDFGDGSTDTAANPGIHTYTKPGKYTVRLKTISAFGCVDSITKADFIEVYHNPLINFKWDPKKIKKNDGRVNFSQDNQYTDEFDFLFGDGTGLTAEPNTHYAFMHRYTDTGYFYVKLIARNNFGCGSELDDTLYIEDYFTWFIPTAFSPNKDGVNEFFRPVSTFVKQYDMQIFDRWGQLVFAETCHDKWFQCRGWDGSYKGEPLPSDYFVYKIVFTDEDGRRHNESGTLLLAR
jgi:gliding motility-associated-like protein